MIHLLSKNHLPKILYPQEDWPCCNKLRDILHASEGRFGKRFAVFGVLNCHRQTDRQTLKQTDGHGDSMTKSAQFGQFSENVIKDLVRTGI